jgi:hypothetical protein
MTADLYRQRLGPEATSVALTANRDFYGFFIFGFRIAGHAQSATLGASALFAVKGKKSRIQLFQTDAAGRADT